MNRTELSDTELRNAALEILRAATSPAEATITARQELGIDLTINVLPGCACVIDMELSATPSGAVAMKDGTRVLAHFLGSNGIVRI